MKGIPHCKHARQAKSKTVICKVRKLNFLPKGIHKGKAYLLCLFDDSDQCQLFTKERQRPWYLRLFNRKS